METKITAKLALSISSIAILPAAFAATAQAQEPAVPAPQSYADLLEPIPNAVEKLRVSDAQEMQRVRFIKVDEHHHHHHHHHHASAYYTPFGYTYVQPYSYSYDYYSYGRQPYAYSYGRDYYGGRRHWRRERREHHHHHHHHHHHEYRR